MLGTSMHSAEPSVMSDMARPSTSEPEHSQAEGVHIDPILMEGFRAVDPTLMEASTTHQGTNAELQSLLGARSVFEDKLALEEKKSLIEDSVLEDSVLGNSVLEDRSVFEEQASNPDTDIIEIIDGSDSEDMQTAQIADSISEASSIAGVEETGKEEVYEVGEHGELAVYEVDEHGEEAVYEMDKHGVRGDEDTHNVTTEKVYHADVSSASHIEEFRSPSPVTRPGFAVVIETSPKALSPSSKGHSSSELEMSPTPQARSRRDSSSAPIPKGIKAVSIKLGPRRPSPMSLRLQTELPERPGTRHSNQSSPITLGDEILPGPDFSDNDADDARSQVSRASTTTSTRGHPLKRKRGGHRKPKLKSRKSKDVDHTYVPGRQSGRVKEESDKDENDTDIDDNSPRKRRRKASPRKRTRLPSPELGEPFYRATSVASDASQGIALRDGKIIPPFGSDLGSPTASRRTSPMRSRRRDGRSLVREGSVEETMGKKLRDGKVVPPTPIKKSSQPPPETPPPFIARDRPLLFGAAPLPLITPPRQSPKKRQGSDVSSTLGTLEIRTLRKTSVESAGDGRLKRKGTVSEETSPKRASRGGGRK